MGYVFLILYMSVNFKKLDNGHYELFDGVLLNCVPLNSLDVL